eukprot:165682-Amphidinium_carterae.1
MFCKLVHATVSGSNLWGVTTEYKLQAVGVSMLQTARLPATDALDFPRDVVEENLLKLARTDRSSLSERTTCLVSEDGCLDYHLESELPCEEVFEGVEIVVTRYKEDITWLDFLADFDTVVYNKGGLDTLLPAARPNLRIVPMENTGREDETMLRHIIASYHNASNITVFLQGWPYNHCSELGNTLRRA